jgi:hypothetical protein
MWWSDHDEVMKVVEKMPEASVVQVPMKRIGNRGENVWCRA